MSRTPSHSPERLTKCPISCTSTTPSASHFPFPYPSASSAQLSSQSFEAKHLPSDPRKWTLNYDIPAGHVKHVLNDRGIKEVCFSAPDKETRERYEEWRKEKECTGAGDSSLNSSQQDIQQDQSSRTRPNRRRRSSSTWNRRAYGYVTGALAPPVRIASVESTGTGSSYEDDEDEEECFYGEDGCVWTEEAARRGRERHRVEMESSFR